MARTTSLLRYLVLLMITSMVVVAVACSQPAAPTPTTKPAAPAAATSAPAAATPPAKTGATAAPAGATAAATAPAAASGPKITIKGASGGFPVPGGPEAQVSDQVIAWQVFEAQLNKYTNKVDLQVFHSLTLGDEAATMQGARLGVPAQMASGAINNLHPFAPSVGFATLPYMFKDRVELKKVLDKMWDELDERIAKEAGVRVIAYFVPGWRHMTNSKKAIKTIDDLKGLKFRVPPNQIMVATYKAWGVEPLSLAYSELYQALQQKVVDGHDLPAPAHYSGKFYETQKYFTPLHHNLLIDVIVMGEQSYRGLPKDVQEAVTKAGRDTLAMSMAQIQKAEDDSIKEMEKAGLEVVELTDEAEWAARSKKIWPDFYAAAGGKSLVDKIEEIKKAP